MKKRIVVNAAVVGALIAVTASAWGMKEALSNSTWLPAPSVAAEASAPPAPAQPLPPADPEATAIEALPSNEHVPAASETAELPRPRVMPLEAAALPRIEHSAPQPPITVEKQRLSLDERIQADVIDKLAQAPNLSGKIGVETRDAVVTLSGWTTTSGQAHRAGRYASSVEGVKMVQNEIRPRVGGSI
ncbi:MAG: BON domain-containing protein [Betaproteobacteria bacterium]